MGRPLSFGHYLAFSALLLAGAGCSGSTKVTATQGVQAPPSPTPSPSPTSSPLPQLVSTVSTCTSVAGPCAQTDLSLVSHSIPSTLFGDGIEWQNYGDDAFNPDLTNQTPGSVRPEILAALQSVGLTLMRYPGGTLADLFHWQGAVGPMSGRTAQDTMSVNSTTNQLVTQLPYFGPDEFSSFAKQLGTPIILTTNVGTGYASEAASWISYWESEGVFPAFVEIGNEMYLAGPGTSFAAMTPQAYATAFDTYAAAIRAVDPAIKLGVLGTLDTSSWCYPNCTAPTPWNQIVLQGITQKADFMAVHNAYSPGTTTASLSIYQAMLSYANFIRLDDSLIEGDIDLFGNAQTKGIPLATTEHASFFLTAATDAPTILSDLQRNQTLASALYSALTYQGFIMDARCQVANHINPQSAFWQAPITVALPGAGYPGTYATEPTLSAFGMVFQSYRELAGQNYVPVTVTGSPTITTSAVGNIPDLDNTPLLDAIAATGATSNAAAKGWLFLINRGLTASVQMPFVLKNIPAGATTLEIDVLTAGAYTAMNLPGAAPQVEWQVLQKGLLPSGANTFGTTITLPPYSLIRARIN